MLWLVHLLGMNLLANLERGSLEESVRGSRATTVLKSLFRKRFATYRLLVRLTTLSAMVGLAVWLFLASRVSRLTRTRRIARSRYDSCNHPVAAALLVRGACRKSNCGFEKVVWPKSSRLPLQSLVMQKQPLLFRGLLRGFRMREWDPRS